MTISDNDRRVLVELLSNLGAGELSTIVAALNEPGSLIGTTKDSANYTFLSKLIELDMAEEKRLDIDLPPDLAVTLTSIEIYDDAKPHLKPLLRGS